MCADLAFRRCEFSSLKQICDVTGGKLRQDSKWVFQACLVIGRVFPESPATVRRSVPSCSKS